MSSVHIKGQKLAGTSLDSQGERLSLDELRAYCDFCKGKRMPLHQQHQMGEPTTGYIENVQIAQDPADQNEWCVIGDVTIEHGSLDKGLRGFSISFVAPLVERAGADCLLYIPYPHYNDAALVSDLASDVDLEIGRWIKKNVDPSSHALFYTVLAFALTPVWDHFYKSRSSPIIDRFLDAHLSRLQAKGLELEHVQMVFHAGHEVELRFIPERGKERWCFSQISLVGGIKLVAARLENDQMATECGVRRVVLRFDPTQRAYEVVRTEYRNGIVSE